jgi:AraC family transcriptional regulator
VRASVGDRLGHFRAGCSLERVAYRLTRSSVPVTNVAFDSGYGSHASFTRAFARAFGEAPIAFCRGGTRPF